jgi:hypothetical protein
VRRAEQLQWIAAALLGVALAGAALVPGDAVALERGEGLLLLPIAALAWLLAAARPGLRLDWGRRVLGGVVVLWLVWMVGATLAVDGRGDLRAAVNELWWWVTAVLLLFAGLRMLDSEGAARGLAALVVSVAAGQAVLALYQQWISLPADRLLYELHPERVLRESGIDAPEGSPLRALFRDRLYGGGPTGTFALTNTLAGYLLWGVVLPAALLGAHLLGRGNGRREWSGRLAALAALVLCAIALAYTSSRTGWLAASFGLLVVGVGLVGARQAPGRLRRWAGPLFLFLQGLAVVAVFLTAMRPGIWDALPRSLLFRFQYWAATLRLASDQPWWGAGPGNFQSAYLRYRLPEASESIADPHNWFMETLGAGGWPALMLWALALGVACGSSAARTGEEAPSSRARTDEGQKGSARAAGPEVGWAAVGLSAGESAAKALAWGGLAAFVLLLLKWILFLQREPLPLLCAVGTAGGVYWGLRACRWGSGLAAGIYGAVIAMTVHWLASGGWTVPGLTVSWLLLVATLLAPWRDGYPMGSPPSDSRDAAEADGATGRAAIGWVIRGTGCVAVVLAWWGTAWRPVTGAQPPALRAAEAYASQRLDQAERLFTEAAAIDRWDPLLALRLAEARLWLAMRERDDRAERRDAWEEALAEVAARHPISPALAGERAAQRIQMYQRFGRRSDLRAAREQLRQAVRWAPSEEQHTAQLAVVAAALGDAQAAESHWQRAEWLSQQGGHADRSLDWVQLWLPAQQGRSVLAAGPRRESARAAWESVRGANQASVNHVEDASQ